MGLGFPTIKCIRMVHSNIALKKMLCTYNSMPCKSLPRNSFISRSKSSLKEKANR